jgi:predicted TIM-barrel fold metal-dependent hydrolase
MADAESKDLSLSARMYWAAEGYRAGGVIREIDYSQQKGGVHPLFEGIKIVDCDTHITEAPDLWTSRAPAKYRNEVPHVARDNDGVDRWFCHGQDFGPACGGGVIGKDYNKLLGRLSYPTIEEAHKGTYSMKPRVQMMDDMGVWAQICFQNSGVTQPAALVLTGGSDFADTVIRIYNDASAEYQQESGQRVFNMAHLPYWDQKLMVAEARRCIDMGLKGFVLPDKPEMMGLNAPGLPTDHWAPVLEMMNDTNTPITFHINAAIDPGTVVWEGFPFQQKLSIYPLLGSMACAATMGNWMVSGLLDKYPKLKIGLIEAGLGWVPFALEMLEHQFDEMLPGHASFLDKRPWEYFRDHFWTTFWFEKIGPRTQLEVVGVDKVLFETDYPHPTSIYPDVQSRIVERLGDQPYEVRKKVLQDNASTLFNLGL